MYPSYSLYLHIPFCKQRCRYCDFVTYAGKAHLIPNYLDALKKEILLQAKLIKRKISLKSVYFGGGTPSIIPVEYYGEILREIRNYFLLEENAEISMEINPGAISKKFLKNARAFGINRLSIGMQSANDLELEFLGRIHRFTDVIETYKLARDCGFLNINLDLIFGLPGQVVKDWKRSISAVMDLQPEHVSLYSLSIEHDTPLGKLLESGVIEMISDDLAAEMYELADDWLARLGYMHYEISNWARRSQNGQVQYSLHNLQYWLNEPYLGLGAGAHSCYDGWRLENTGNLEEYIQLMSNPIDQKQPFSPANIDAIKIDRFTSMQETMMLGLRLVNDGVDLDGFFQKYGVKAEEIFSKEIAKLEKLGLVEFIEKNCLRLTKKGILLGNQAFLEFVGDRIKIRK